jgi:2-methylcitrate dehydratase PrpD
VQSASARIAQFAAQIANQPLRRECMRQAFRAVLDTVAVALAAREEDTVRIAQDFARTLGGGAATAWCTGEAMHPEAAAWLNGVTAHVLDYDDVMTMMRGHVSVAMVPALVALAQSTGARGSRLAAGYVAGFELMAKLARVMALPHYSKGWHSTSTLGVLGAAMACSVLLGLNAAQTANALGLAVAQAAGSRANFGTMAKSFQAGECNGAAVRAVLLAQAGFTASPSAIDGKYGFLALYGAGKDLAPELATLGQVPLEIEATGIDIKKYPCCYAIHRALDALFTLRGRHQFATADIGGIEVTNSAGGLEALQSRLPVNGLEAKFSMEYNMAAAVVDGFIRLSSFADAQVRRAAIANLMSRVGVHEAQGSILPRWSHVKVTLGSGVTLEERVSVARGDAGDPLTDADLTEKALDCFAFGGSTGDVRAFAARVLGMADDSVDDVVRSLPR